MDFILMCVPSMGAFILTKLRYYNLKGAIPLCSKSIYASKAQEARRMDTQSIVILYMVPRYREKKRKRKETNLIRLGIDPLNTRKWSFTRMGGWAVALSPILKTAITIDRLKKRGYISLQEYYQKARIINEPPSTWPVRFILSETKCSRSAWWCERCSGGVTRHSSTRLAAVNPLFVSIAPMLN